MDDSDAGRHPDGLPQVSFEERYRLLADHATDMVSLHDAEGVYLYASPSTREILGYAPSELVGRDAYDLFHPDDLPAIGRSHESILTGLGIADVTYRIRRKDGSWIWFETRSRAIRGPEGTVTRVVAASRDVSKRVRTERSLAESEARFRGAFESAGIGMALVSPEGRCLRVNAALCRLFAYPEYRLLQMTFQELTHPDDLDADLALLERTLAGELPGYEMEKRYLDADGREIHAHLTVSLVRDPDGRPLYFISQIQDVTEREETLARLRQALAEVRRLEGLLPICSHCKAIRGEDGRWEPLEAYLDRRSDVSFSHGICPRCERAHFPEP